jgi:DNA-binding LacI/PurR family transcriptional regulator
MPTISDIARIANVSVSTVSYAINGTRSISEETRARIFAAMEEIGYRPNVMARGLASKRSRIIALLFPDLGIGLGATALGFFFNTADAARKLGYNLVLWPSVLSAKDLNEHLRQGLVDGVIVMEVALNDERVNLLRKLNFPFSMIGRTSDLQGLNYVDIDIRQSIDDAVNALLQLGHTHIAFLNTERGAPAQSHGPSVRSQAAFVDAMQSAGAKASTSTAACRPNAGFDAFNAMLAADPDLTAIITINDYAIPGIVQAITSRGWSVPDDFSIIVGPTSSQMAEMMTPPLTSIDIPIAEMSRVGVKQLVQQLENQDLELTQLLIPCQLITRGSTGPYKPRQ